LFGRVLGEVETIRLRGKFEEDPAGLEIFFENSHGRMRLVHIYIEPVIVLILEALARGRRAVLPVNSMQKPDDRVGRLGYEKCLNSL
jgi:hypothetical protein